MKNITYLIPLDGKGGVEIAAQKLKNLNEKNFTFKIQYIFQNESQIFNIIKIFESLRKVIANSPDILITSLWRAALVGIVVKIVKPKMKFILFIHSEKNSHFFDFLITRLALLLCNETWFDSNASLKNRFKFFFKKLNYFILPFHISKVHYKSNLHKKNEPNFIYWGRISKDKGLYRALNIFEGILNYFPRATFKIIGSHKFDFDEIYQYCVDRKLTNSVHFYDEMEFERIKKLAGESSYYLQTSKFEGFAMSVVESMMMGLVPVVTPVGEIKKYCNYKNSILVYSNMEAIRDVVLVLRSNDNFSQMSNLAMQTWIGKTLYKDAVIENCNRLAK